MHKISAAWGIFDFDTVEITAKLLDFKNLKTSSFISTSFFMFL